MKLLQIFGSFFTEQRTKVKEEKKKKRLSRVQVKRRTGVRPSYCGGAAFLDIVEIVYSYRTSIVEGTNHREQQRC